MRRITEYFREHSSNDRHFRLEFEAAKRMLDNLDHTSKLNLETATDIVKIYNETTAAGHGGGSGWLDFQLHLKHLLTIDNLKVEIDKSSGRLSVSAR